MNGRARPEKRGSFRITKENGKRNIVIKIYI